MDHWQKWQHERTDSLGKEFGVSQPRQPSPRLSPAESQEAEEPEAGPWKILYLLVWFVRKWADPNLTAVQTRIIQNILVEGVGLGARDHERDLY